MIEITSLKNPLIKEISFLKTKKGRWTSKAYIIEGIKMTREALLENKVHKLILNESIRDIPEIIDLIELCKSSDSIICVPAKVFVNLTEMENSQGVIAISRFDDISVEDLPETGRYVYLDSIQDPGNCGTIIRSADAFGFNGIVFGHGSVDPYNPKSVQASMGSIFRMKLFFSRNTIIDLELLMDRGYRVISTEVDGAISLHDFNFSDQDIIVIGNEGNGISRKVMDISSHRISIPMMGRAESLNAGVAASLIMYEAAKTSR